MQKPPSLQCTGEDEVEISRVLRQQGLPPAYMGKGGGTMGHGSE